MPTPFRPSRLAFALASATCVLAAGHAHGSAFALQETSGSSLGNAFAAGAAAADDASAMWSNPAVMARFGNVQAAAAVTFITPSFKFHNDNSVAAALQPLGGTGGDAGSLNVVPNLYLSVPVAPNWAVGVGINVPFGLVTEYDSNWIGRYQAIKSDVKTVNVNPAIAWRMNNVAIGVGANYQRIDATFTNAVNYSAALAQAAGIAAAAGQIPPTAVPAIAGAVAGLDARASVDGDDSAWGWNAGIMIDLDPRTRLGAQYRSSIKYNIAGNVSIDKPALPALPPTLAPVVGALSNAVNAVLANGGITADIELPASANVSLFHTVNDRWDVMGDVQWTRWSSLKELRFVRTTGAVLASTPENFRNTWRVSVGANYRMNDRWTFRGGVAYDQSPVNDTDRTPRLPDENRTWFSLGAQYKVSQALRLDLGATYVKVDRPSINQNAGSTAASGLINGHYDADVAIIGGQVSYAF